MRTYLLGLVGLLIAGFAAWYLWWPARSVRLSLRVATGKLTNPPNHMTKFLLDRAARYNLNITLVDVAGSEQSLKLLEDGEIDVALIRGGMKLVEQKNVRQLTNLDVEIFHLLIRGELAEQAEKDLRVLRGKRISINKAATGTHYWSLDILDFLELEPDTPAKKGNFTPLTLDNQDLLKICTVMTKGSAEEKKRVEGEMPDAILFGGPLPSTVPNRLVHQAGYRILATPFAQAYIQTRKREGFSNDALNPAAALEVATLPAFTYGVSPPVPPRDAPALGLRRVVIAHKDANTEALHRLLRVFYAEAGDGAFDPVELAKMRPEYELHPAVTSFRDEQEQVLQKTLIRLGEKAAGLIGGLVGLGVAIWGYYRWRRLLRFEKFFHDVLAVEQVARGLQVDPAAPAEPSARVRYLQERLADLRRDVIGEFAGGKLQGETLILGILTLITASEAALPGLVRAAPVTPAAQPA
jgi:hypothetical protein